MSVDEAQRRENIKQARRKSLTAADDDDDRKGHKECPGREVSLFRKTSLENAEHVRASFVTSPMVTAAGSAPAATQKADSGEGTSSSGSFDATEGVESKVHGGALFQDVDTGLVA